MDAKVTDIIKIMNTIAPPTLAEEKDNIGLQCGHPDQAVKKIRVALDPTMQVVNEADQDNIDILITHHPLLFRPLASIDFSKGAICRCFPPIPTLIVWKEESTIYLLKK